MLILGQRVVQFIGLSILTALVIAGCNTISKDQFDKNTTTTPSSLANCRKVKHDVGETKVCGQPQKVVALSAHTLDLLLSLGVQPVGYAAPITLYRGDRYNNPAQQIPYLGTRVTSKPINLGRANQPSFEKLVQLKPDLIIGESGNKDYSLFSQIAPTLFWKNRTIKGKWQQHIRQIAKSLGREEKAKQAIENYNQRINSARIDLAPIIANYPKLLVLGTDQLQKNILIINPDSYLGEVLQGIGFELVFLPDRKTTKPSIPISIETLPQLDQADIIIVLGYKLNTEDEQQSSQNRKVKRKINQRIENHQLQTAKKAWSENAIAQSLTASQEGRVYFATYYRWNGLNGPIGTSLIIQQLRQFLLSNNASNHKP
ncbi:ABC transporter substrate-binding protein [Calothrix rhizosoleniae]|uniref:ABC transporter substrate-binding protein n=1 Tax=Calothrix rhizosoleniae TaxID=888997 RepID=UPI000B49F866|nr:iron-siderophore ABC transporter substrate-binding protein [Calothrix rhizosoleniae]